MIPLALVVAIVVADGLAPREIQLSPLLVAVPAITGSFAGPGLTTLAGVLALAGHVIVDVRNDLLGTRNVQTQLVALVLVSVLVALLAFLRERHRQELTRVRSVSEAAQRALLRPLPARLGRLRLAAMYMAAEEEAQIGGDLYAVVRTGAGVRLIIGDVRGKGLPAVSDAALLLGAFREAARCTATLHDVAVYLDQSVRADLRERAECDEEAIENFITATVIEIPDDEPVLDMIDCGHPPPLLIREGHVTPIQVARPALPLGLGEISDPDYQVVTFDFRAGDTLLLYTDGVTEARCPRGTFYPLAERVATWSGDGPDMLVEKVRDDLLAHVGGRLGDDAALVAIQCAPE